MISRWGALPTLLLRLTSPPRGLGLGAQLASTARSCRLKPGLGLSEQPRSCSPLAEPDPAAVDPGAPGPQRAVLPRAPPAVGLCQKGNALCPGPAYGQGFTFEQCLRIRHTLPPAPAPGCTQGHGQGGLGPCSWPLLKLGASVLAPQQLDPPGTKLHSVAVSVPAAKVRLSSPPRSLHCRRSRAGP